MKKAQKEKSLGWFILFAAGLIIAGYTAGYLWPQDFTGIVQPAVQKIQQIGAKIPNAPPSTAVITIFVNNAIVAIALILLGGIAGVYPAWVMWMNGVVLGAVTQAAVAKTHASLIKVLAYAILPHGVVEIAALTWAAGLGFNLGFVSSRWIFRAIRLRARQPLKRGEQSFRGELRRCVHHVPFILALLLIAALIEGLVTPQLVQML